MSNPLPSVPPTRPVAVPVEPSSGLWDRLTTWVSENKATAITIAGVAVVCTGGVIYYLNSEPSSQDAQPRLSKKKRRELKKEAERQAAAAAAQAEKSSSEQAGGSADKPKPAAVEADLPEVIDEAYVATLSPEEQRNLADRLKKAGNSAFGDKAYNKAIDLYSKAILCKKDPVYYANRAACWAALSDHEKVVEDSNLALSLDRKYVKVLNRRAKAYEELHNYREALFSYTVVCILEGFSNPVTSKGVERMIHETAKKEGTEKWAQRKPTLPSSTFLNNYFGSFRPQPRPAGLEDTAELPDGTGKAYMQAGLRALEQGTSDGYEEARQAFDKALKMGDLGDYEALAYSMRGTFRTLMGDTSGAIEDLKKSIDMDPRMIPSYIKLAATKLEQGGEQEAFELYKVAMEANDKDPDIWYHRGQLNFIKGDYDSACKDFQMSMDLDREFVFSHIQLAVTQFKMGSIASSMATFKRAIKNFPKSPEVYHYYGELLMDSQKFTEAIEKFDTAIELANKHKPLSINVAPLVNKGLTLYQMRQDFDEAINYCKKALIIDPSSDIAIATLAQLYLQREDIAEASNYFRRSIDLARSEFEMINAISYYEATACQLRVHSEYPDLAAQMREAGAVAAGAGIPRI